MGFRTGAYARIWKVEDKGNYSLCNLSISRKKKDSDEFDTEFQDGFVRLVGNAHEFAKGLKIGKSGAPVKITSCDVTNRYDAKKGSTYVNFAIFGLEDATYGSITETPAVNKSAKKSNRPTDIDMLDDDDAQLPF